ncbi:hypothetical protein [Comamonas kerstersii]|uniref:hypothetical protein n=1 Tax=Comamonas kerstersii TaxID=225992 RepID=UPI001B32CA96|nr:hypothetical protein [Comamonas kerstersii]QTW17583.1 hypothetical protein H8N02_09895 [Comamonas kerstersii]
MVHIEGYILPKHFVPLELTGSERQALLRRDEITLLEGLQRSMQEQERPRVLQLPDLPYAAEIANELAGKPPDHISHEMQRRRGFHWRLDTLLSPEWVLPNGLVFGDKHMPLGLVNSAFELVIRNLRTPIRTEVNKFFPV